MPKRKVIELVLDNEQGMPGVEAISLVKYPAIESNFVYFSKQGSPSQFITMGSVDEEKMTLVGPAMIPDKMIPRYDEDTGEEYDVYFSKDTVKQAAEFFLKQNRTNSHTYEHQSAIENVSVVESWIVEDEKRDKQTLYNLSNPVGTWMVRIHCANEEMWNEVKAGKLQGLSIEGYFLDRVQQMSKPKLTERTMLERIYNFISKRKFYAEVTLGNGDVIATEDDEIGLGSGVYKLDDKGQPCELPNGHYQTEGGIEIEVYDGVIVEYDGQVAAVEEKAETAAEPKQEVDMMKVSYLKNLYKQKLSKYKKTKMAARRRAFTDFTNDVVIYLRPLGVDAADKGFQLFDYDSYDDYVDAVQEWLTELSDNYGTLVEETEVVDYWGIGRQAIDNSVEGISETAFDVSKWIAEKASELNVTIDLLVEALQDMDVQSDEIEFWWNSNFLGRMSVNEYAAQLVDEGVAPLADYFDYAAFGKDLQLSGDLSELLEESGDISLAEEVENMNPAETAEWYLDYSGQDVSDLGEQTVKDYFDLEMFARDLEIGGDVTQYGSDNNALLFRA